MKKILITMICGIILYQQYAGASDFRFSPRPNKAHLIQWRTWSKAVMEEARKKNRLIVLSLSAVWCHWCHVMDETTYSDDAVISYINENFIPVRVDADMRPDIDALYNQGGWPSTAILTPQGEVVSGGNYIPPEEMLGRLKRDAELFAKNPSAIEDRIEERKATNDVHSTALVAGIPDKSVIDNILEILKSSFDGRNGGFGQGQKFPSPDSIDFLLALYAKNKDVDIKRNVILTLDRMAQGEICDKVEGGFFRYATRPDWSEPHFEKMLDVNAGMIENYANASLVLGKKEYVKVMQETIRYVRANLYDEASGVFFGSQDADESYYKKQDRTGDKAPFVDRIVYVDSSSLMISALIASYGATLNEQYLHMAAKCADYLLARLYSTQDGMFHFSRNGAPQLKGLLSDNALVGLALLDLYNATGDTRYLKPAREIGWLILSKFYDADTRRFRTTLVTPNSKPVTAGVLSEMNDDLSNFRTLRFLGRLDYVGENKNLKEVRDAVAATLSGEYERFTPQAAAYGNALLWIVSAPVQFTILSDRENAQKYLSVISGIYMPQKVVQVLSLARDREEIAKRKYSLKESVYLCSGKRCSAPINDPERLGVVIRNFLESASKR
jgi:uncharacterized protein